MDLAQGTTELYATPCGTLVSLEPIETIVALGPLIKMGCRLQWGDKECILWHPSKSRHKLAIDSGCPRVSEELALSLIQDIEHFKVKHVSAAIRAIEARDSQRLPPPQQAIQALVDAVLKNQEVAGHIGETILSLWPGVPNSMLHELTTWVEYDSNLVVFNRRKRRAIQRASKVLLHLCAGDSRREIEKQGSSKGFQVVSVGESEDLRSPQTFGYLLRQAAAGRLDAIWGAPPCGSNSLCRFITPGPRPVRTRSGEERRGLKDLTESERTLVQRADELYLRVLLVMHVAMEGNRAAGKPDPWNLLENPQDPEEYLDSGSALWLAAHDKGGFPSFFATDEFVASARCRACIAASAKQRPHRRITCPASWVLSADTIGPFKKSEDETSTNLRYVVVACLVVPVDDKGRPADQEQAADKGDSNEKHEEEDKPEPEHDGPSAEAEDILEELREAFRDDDDPDERPVHEPAMKACHEDARDLTDAERQCMVKGLKWKELIFTEPVRRKNPASVEQALTKIILEIAELGFPITRLHGDHGAEFVNMYVRRMATKYSLRQTCSAPEEHNSNGRIENVIQRLKAQMRVHLHAPGSEVSLWPLAARAVSTTWRTQTLRSMGLPLPQVVPYGTRVQVLARTWLRRTDEKTWSLKAVQATVLCPASLVKLGYVVRIKKRLSVVTKLFEGQDPSLITSLPQEQEELPVAHSLGPEGRIEKKTSRPSMSHVPAPKVRMRHKAPGPGRVPIVCKVCHVDDLHNTCDEDLQAQALADQKPFDVRRAIAFVLQSSYTKQEGTAASDNSRRGTHRLFGAYKFGGMVYPSSYCLLRPGMCSLLAAIMKELHPTQQLSVVVLSVGTTTTPEAEAILGPGCAWSRAVLEDTKLPDTYLKSPQTHQQQSTAVEVWAGYSASLGVIPKAVAQSVQKQFAFPSACGKGGDHPEDHPEQKILQDSSSHQLHANSTQQFAGSGEGTSSQDSSSRQLQANSTQQFAGSGEGTSLQDSSCSQLHVNSSQQFSGSGEGYFRMQGIRGHFCRICESREAVNEHGRCNSCGIRPCNHVCFSVHGIGEAVASIAPIIVYPKTQKIA